MGIEHADSGYWESHDFDYSEMTCDQVINAIFESGAPGNAFFLITNTDKEHTAKIIVAWGDEWHMDRDDDEQEYRL